MTCNSPEACEYFDGRGMSGHSIARTGDANVRKKTRMNEDNACCKDSIFSINTSDEWCGKIGIKS
jgi:hypothetical protein